MDSAAHVALWTRQLIPGSDDADRAKVRESALEWTPTDVEGWIQLILEMSGVQTRFAPGLALAEKRLVSAAILSDEMLSRRERGGTLARVIRLSLLGPQMQLAGNAAVVELAEARAAKDYRRDQVDLKEEVARLRRAADVFGNNRANRAGLVGPLSDAKSAAQRILRRATVVSTERDVAQYLLSVSLGDESPDACTFLDRVAALAPRGLLGDTLRNWCAVLMLRLPMPVGDDHRASRVWDDLVHIGGLRLFPRLAELLGQGEGSFGSTIEASASVVNEVLVVTELRDGRWD